MPLLTVPRLAAPAALIALLTALQACASADGQWPSLLTAQERASGKIMTAQASADDGAADGAADGVVPASAQTAEAAARLVQLRRDFAAAQERWASLKADADRAIAQTQGGEAGSTRTGPVWAAAQLAVSRMNNAAVRFDELRASTDQVAGDLAVQAAQGQQVSGPLADTGRLIARIQQAREDQLQAATQAAAALSR